MKTQTRKTDITIASIFFVLTISFIAIFMNTPVFFDWAFDRHQNQWSWYLRPLFLIPFCYFAYQKSLAGMMLSVFAVFTSMFWFPKPEIVDENVIEFLAFEKDYLLGKWNSSKILMAATIPISFFILGLTFWKRSLPMGTGVIVLIATGKIIWSIENAGESGKSILIPAILGLLICGAILLFGFYKLKKNKR
ncbi:hypothetical protein [Tenacibaculum xiamenense]|uniref:hypothetical protein n=1 Tax=Tenacibaculum xiamenense TaxID=1261553 RepID=UPI00389379D7